MKTLITIEVENEIGNPSVEEVKSFVKQILEKGLVGNFDIYKYCPMSGISLRVLNAEVDDCWLAFWLYKEILEGLEKYVGWESKLNDWSQYQARTNKSQP